MPATKLTVGPSTVHDVLSGLLLAIQCTQDRVHPLHFLVAAEAVADRLDGNIDPTPLDRPMEKALTHKNNRALVYQLRESIKLTDKDITEFTLPSVLSWIAGTTNGSRRRCAIVESLTHTILSSVEGLTGERSSEISQKVLDVFERDYWAA